MGLQVAWASQLCTHICAYACARDYVYGRDLQFGPFFLTSVDPTAKLPLDIKIEALMTHCTLLLQLLLLSTLLDRVATYDGAYDAAADDMRSRTDDEDLVQVYAEHQAAQAVDDFDARVLA